MLKSVVGMQKSSESATIYHRIEAKHALATTFLYQAIQIGVLGYFILSAALPISYACFDHPSPTTWILPLEI